MTSLLRSYKQLLIMRVDIQTIQRGTTLPGVVMPQLSHGVRVAHVVTEDETFLETDAIWTENQSLTLGVTTADCAPICFSDGVRVGVVHAGWRGLASGIIQNMLQEFLADTLQVHIGPHLHQFEVKRDDCCDQLVDAVGLSFFTEQADGVLLFDFTQALLSVLPSDTTVDPRNTATDLTLPSYRHARNDRRILTTVRFS